MWLPHKEITMVVKTTASFSPFSETLLIRPTTCHEKLVLTLSRRHKTSIILLWLTPVDFTRQRESSRLERVNGVVVLTGKANAGLSLWGTLGCEVVDFSEFSDKILSTVKVLWN